MASWFGGKTAKTIEMNLKQQTVSEETYPANKDQTEPNSFFFVLTSVSTPQQDNVALG